MSDSFSLRVAKAFQLAEKVAAMHLIASNYFNPGDLVFFGKYKNKKGVVLRVFKDDRGIPCIEIEPIPKGRKQNKIMGLFNLWHADLEKR